MTPRLTLACLHTQSLCDKLYAFGLSREDQQSIVQDALKELAAAEAAEAEAKERQKREAEEALKV
jgi:hypothetical protein